MAHKSVLNSFDGGPRSQKPAPGSTGGEIEVARRRSYYDLAIFSPVIPIQFLFSARNFGEALNV